MEDTNYLLMRNWFLNQEEIEDLLWELNQDEYDKIYQNRHKYPMNVRLMIEPLDFNIIATNPKIKLKLKELSERDLLQMDKMKEQALIQKQTKEWNEYVSKNKLERPLSGCDTELDTIYEQLQRIKTQQSDYVKTKKSGKYVPVHMRNVAPVKDQRELEFDLKIQKLNEEFKNCELLIKQEDEQWLERQRLTWIKKYKVF